MNKIYEEKQRSSMMAIIIFLVIAFVFGTTLFANYKEYGVASIREADQMTFLIMAVLFIFLFVFFYNLKITLTEEQLEFGFGPFKKKIAKGEIKTISIKQYEFKNYLGYGIRLGRADKSWGYVAGNTSGVLIDSKKGKFYFTTDNPEQIVDLIKQHLM